jgi:DNA-binding MarR family transcriptional regulator
MSMTATKDDGGIEEFIRMWEVWQSILPKSLRRGDPKFLIRLLQRIESGDNIFQLELKSKLDVKQPRLSKLMRKLEDAEWIQIEKPADDRRKRRVVLSPAGRTGLADIRSKLKSGEDVSPPRTRAKPIRKGIQEVAGQTSFFSDDQLVEDGK